MSVRRLAEDQVQPEGFRLMRKTKNGQSKRSLNILKVGNSRLLSRC